MRRWRANPWVVFGALALAALIPLGAWFLTPVPSAMLIRALFHVNAEKTLAEMQPFAPTSGLTQTLNVEYGDAGTDTQLDVFTPFHASGSLPTVGHGCQGRRKTCGPMCSCSPRPGSPRSR